MNHGTDNQKVLGNCPTCQRLMQIPVVTNVASVAKCPHCNNEIRVRDLLASAVPEAEIVDKDNDNDKNSVSDYVADRQRVYDDSKPKTREKFEVPNQLYNGASRRNRKRRGGSKGGSSSRSSSRDSSPRSSRPRNNGSSSNARTGSPSTNGGVASSRRPNASPQSPSAGNGSRPATSSSSAASSTPVSKSSATSVAPAAPSVPQKRRSSGPTPVARPRSSSRGRSSSEMDDEVEFGLAEVVKFMFGGLIAAPLAYLALLWVLGVDPFGMASTFESISPVIIPDSLRSESVSAEPQGGFAPPAGDSSGLILGDESGEAAFEDDVDGLPLPSLDPDLVR